MKDLILGVVVVVVVVVVAFVVVGNNSNEILHLEQFHHFRLCHNTLGMM